MISVKDAIEQIRKHTQLLSPFNSSLRNASGLVLAEDVFAPVSVPHFNQSAMDGYAFRFADLEQTNEFIISGEVAAGDHVNTELLPMHAVRIFTGAAVPNALDTVVMQEKTEVQDNKIIVLDDSLKKGSNVRQIGSEIKKGSLALPKGTVLTPAAIGFLAGLGMTEVAVLPKPAVHIIVTGKELQTPGQPLQYGQVYESNSVMLQTALEQLHINNVSITVTGDDVIDITNAITKALEDADMVLLTGGVSVGNYDFVAEACQRSGVEQLFHKVAQRPGKPLYCGKKNATLIFGLPGNPASVMSCFYNFVVVAIENLTGRKKLLERKRLPLLEDFSKKIQLTQFLKATCTNEGVIPLGAQESFRLSSFAVANCLILLPEEKRDFAKGELVETILLPYL